MKKLLSLGAFIFALGLLTFVACKKEEVNKNDSSKNDVLAYIQAPQGNQNQIREGRNAFAKSLAKAMTNVSVRAFVKEKLVERYSIDQEFLFIVEKNTIIGNLGKTFLEVIAENADRQFDIRYFDELTNTDPLLSITMSERDDYNITNWMSLPDFIPNVAAQTDGMEEYYQYDQFGQESTNSSSSELNEILVAVWSAEITYLVDANGYNVFGSHIDDFMPTKPNGCEPYLNLLGTTNSYTINGSIFNLMNHNDLVNAYNACPVIFQDPPLPPNDPCLCPRDCEIDDESLVDFKINGWAVYKNIDNQTFETKYVFHGDWVAASRDRLTGTVVPRTLKYVSPSQSKKSLLNCSGVCSGKFISANFRLWQDWKEDELGSPYKISWAEVDPGETTAGVSIPLTVSFKKEVLGQEVTFGVGITPSISRKGTAIVPLGDQFVFYCDPILKPNDTGSITFKCN